MEFLCPEHGKHRVDLGVASDVAKLEYNTPIRNLVRALAYASDEVCSHIRITGSDYAGSYQENFLQRPWSQLASYDGDLQRLHRQPITVYAPLIVDWAGSKLSKSLYVREDAYRYLEAQGMDYLISYERMKASNKDLRLLFDEVGKWVNDPKKLFRSYSIEYLHHIFEKG